MTEYFPDDQHDQRVLVFTERDRVLALEVRRYSLIKLHLVLRRIEFEGQRQALGVVDQAGLLHLPAQRPLADRQQPLAQVRQIPGGTGAQQIGGAEGRLVAEKPLVDDRHQPVQLESEFCSGVAVNSSLR